ncbi:HAD family phosphatase [bacterium]|nr:HAD family phosphatase [bacterium]
MSTQRKLLICFDVDGTLIDDTIFIWQTLHDAIGTDPKERKRWAKAFWDKKISYEEWASSDVRMWCEKKIMRSDIMNHIKALKPMKGAKEVISSLRSEGHELGVISGSLDVALDQVFPEWKKMFCHVFLNHLEFDSRDYLLGIQTTPFDIDYKGDGLVEISKRTGISMENTVFIGDNFNDVSVAKLAGLSIAFNCKSDNLADVSDIVIKGKDLRNILPVIRKFAAQDQTQLNSATS